MRKYNLTKTTKQRNLNLGDIVENANAKLYFDKVNKTERYIKHNRPDLFIIDKTSRTGTLIEVGVSCAHEIERTENKKFEKYVELAEELVSIHNLREIQILPVVMTWEGHSRRRTTKSLKQIGLSKREIAYMQTRLLKRTFEMMVSNERLEPSLEKDNMLPGSPEPKRMRNEEADSKKVKQKRNYRRCSKAILRAKVMYIISNK